jgi:signal transduction histidine kinase
VSNKRREHRETGCTHRRKPETPDGGNILMLGKDVGLGLRDIRQRHGSYPLIEAEKMAVIGRMACSISHDLRHVLTAIYANAEFLERHDLCASVRADLLLEIQEAVLEMTERIDSLLLFGSSGRKNPTVHERVSVVVDKAVAAVKFHPDGRNVSITVAEYPPAEADIDVRNLESAIYNLLLNACQAATRSTKLPEVKVHLTDVDEQIFVTIADNGPGIPASVLRILFSPFVTAGKPNGIGLGLTLARRVAEEHGGSVSIEESNTEGAVFTLSLRKRRSSLPKDLKSDRTDVEAGKKWIEDARAQPDMRLGKLPGVVDMKEPGEILTIDRSEK